MYIFKKLVLFFSITDLGVKDDYKAAFRRAVCSVERRSSKTAYLDIDGTFCKKSLRSMFKKTNWSSCEHLLIFISKPVFILFMSLHAWFPFAASFCCFHRVQRA